MYAAVRSLVNGCMRQGMLGQWMVSLYCSSRTQTRVSHDTHLHDTQPARDLVCDALRCFGWPMLLRIVEEDVDDPVMASRGGCKGIREDKVRYRLISRFKCTLLR